MSTTYGTIPTALSPPSDRRLPSASRSFTLVRRPWREMATALSLPRTFSDARQRLRTNAEYFHVNYFIIVLFVLLVGLIWHPVALLVFFPIIVLWLFVYFLRVNQIAGCAGADRFFVVLFSIFTLYLLLKKAAVGFLIGAAAGLILVVVHGIVRGTDDLDYEDMATVV